MTHSIKRFNLGDMAVCTGAMRRLGNAANTPIEIANALVSYFYDNFVDGTTRDFALVRLFITRPYFSLSQELKDCADKAFSKDFCFPTMKCMVLEATIGDDEAWRDVNSSKSHRVIPLASEDLVIQMPMIYKLISGFGLRVADVVNTPSDILIGSSEEDYNIFLIKDAVGSPYIPAQENFVTPHKIKSAMGFGGLLPSGNLFAIVLFSKTKIVRETADMFRCIALAANLALLRFDDQPIYVRQSPRDKSVRKYPVEARV
jgi:hypothetical protein